MADHYYNAADLGKFGEIGHYQKEMADKFFAYYGEVFKDSASHRKRKITDCAGRGTCGTMSVLHRRVQQATLTKKVTARRR